MGKKCIEQVEVVCKSFPNCNGCNAFRVPTNFDKLKLMDSDEAADTISALLDVCREVAVHGDVAVPELVKKWLEIEAVE